MSYKPTQEIQKSARPKFFTGKKIVRVKEIPIKVNEGSICFNFNNQGHFAKISRTLIKITTDKNKHSRGCISGFSASSELLNADLWYLDLGASMHMTKKNDWMYDIRNQPISTLTVASWKLLLS